MLIGSFFCFDYAGKACKYISGGTEKRHSSDNKRYIIKKIDR